MQLTKNERMGVRPAEGAGSGPRGVTAGPVTSRRRAVRVTRVAVTTGRSGSAQRAAAGICDSTPSTSQVTGAWVAINLTMQD